LVIVGALKTKCNMISVCSLGHFFDALLRTLKQAVEIEACGLLNQGGVVLGAGKVGREVGVAVRERGGDSMEMLSEYLC
jgi:hypothetical protein